MTRKVTGKGDAMNTSCGCCACLAGAGKRVAIWNRPGLSALHYRAGTHATFLEAMTRRLTIPVEGSASNYSLHALTTRESDDPAIALLDAWAVAGDVLTFYQERIANEGFLRTATERRSILELGRLVGYTLRPGVSSSVYLAYTLDDTAKTIIPAGSKAQSIPGANEQPQTFETAEAITARGTWNALTPRLGRPQIITLDNVLSIDRVWIAGTQTRIDAGDPLLFVFKGDEVTKYAMRKVLKKTTDSDADRTEIALDPVRPWYGKMYELVRVEWANQLAGPATPARSPERAMAGATKSTKKKAAASVRILASRETRSRSDVLADLLREILLASPRTTILTLAKLLDDSDVVRQAMEKTPDDDPPAAADPPPWNANILVHQLAVRPALAPASEWNVARSLGSSLATGSDMLPRLLTSFIPRIRTNLYAALGASTAGRRKQVAFDSLHVLHRRAAPFGYNAPEALFEARPSDTKGLPELQPVEEDSDVVYLDTPVESLAQGSYMVARTVLPQVDRKNDIGTKVRTIREIEQRPRTAYGISGKTTRLTLSSDWASFTEMPSGENDNLKAALVANLSILRKTALLLDSEELTLAQRPVDRAVGQAAEQAEDESPTRIHLDGVVDGLKPGRWVIVSGERADTAGTAGVTDAELAMVAYVELEADAGAGARPYSVLVLAPEGLRHRYKRSTVKIYANVVKATHGETRNEILGGGDATKSLQTFTLHQAPLTFVPAPTMSGVVSTLAVRVNDVLWHETESFSGANPTDRRFVTKTADDGKVSVIFGNGREGARLPSGSDNVRAVYRSGIGKDGNVRASQVATAISRPLGVKDVVNPIAASGGADPESRDDARRNIPVSLQAMGRVVSVQDFADFARTFAGISKATAATLTDGRRRVVHLTVGGADDIEIDVDSDLYANLVEALRTFGDPYQPFVVAPREKLVIAGSAGIRVHPDHLWTNVGPKVRARLLDVFSYDRRDFAQPVHPAEVVAAIQSVPGVVYVDLDTLGGIDQSQILDPTGKTGGLQSPKVEGVHPILPRMARADDATDDLLPAQIAYLPPELADLFILTEITP